MPLSEIRAKIEGLRAKRREDQLALPAWERLDYEGEGYENDEGYIQACDEILAALS